MYTYGLMRFDRKQQNSVKQLSFKKKKRQKISIKLKTENTKTNIPPASFLYQQHTVNIILSLTCSCLPPRDPQVILKRFHVILPTKFQNISLKNNSKSQPQFCYQKLKKIIFYIIRKKSRDITLLTKVCVVKAMVFQVVMYGCESWIIQKAECQRTDAFKLWCWRRLFESPLYCKEIKPVSPKRSQP